MRECRLSRAEHERVSRCSQAVCPSSPSRGPGSAPGAEDAAAAVPAGAGGLRDLERGLLPGRRVVRLVDGTRHRVGGRVAPGLSVGSPVRLHPCVIGAVTSNDGASSRERARGACKKHSGGSHGGKGRFLTWFVLIFLDLSWMASII